MHVLHPMDLELNLVSGMKRMHTVLDTEKSTNTETGCVHRVSNQAFFCDTGFVLQLSSFLDVWSACLAWLQQGRNVLQCPRFCLNMHCEMQP